MKKSDQRAQYSSCVAIGVSERRSCRGTGITPGIPFSARATVNDALVTTFMSKVGRVGGRARSQMRYRSGQGFAWGDRSPVLPEFEGDARLVLFDDGAEARRG